MSNISKMPEIELTALMASRICHDLISPVGALINGLEILEDDASQEMREFAMELIAKSAHSAGVKLKFARMAFGAFGSAGSAIDISEAELLAQAFLKEEKPNLIWQSPKILIPKNRVKLLLNLLLVAVGTIPRGGTITLTVNGQDEKATFQLLCAGAKAKIPDEFMAQLSVATEDIDITTLTPHAVQFYYTILLAASTEMTIGVKNQGEDIIISAI